MGQKIKFEDVWISYCDNKYPRNIGFPEQFKVDNSDELVKHIAKNSGHEKPCFVSIYATNKKGNPRVDCLFLDFDVDKKELDLKNNNDDRKEFEACYKEARETKQYLQRLFNANVIMTFSGRRGFHLYLFFDEVKMHQPNDTLQLLCESFTKKLDLKYIDKKVFKSLTTRMARMPYTVHQETDLYSFIMPDDEISIDAIIQIALGPEPQVIKRDISVDFTDMILELDLAVLRGEYKEVIVETETPQSIHLDGGYLKLSCVNCLFENKLKTGGRRMKASKFIAIAYFLDHGKMGGFEEIAEMFAERQDMSHELKVEEVKGWIQGIQQLDNPTWNCFEIKKYLDVDNKLKKAYSCRNCPFIEAKRKATELAWQDKLKDIFEDNSIINRADQLFSYGIVGEENKRKLLFLLLIAKQNVTLKGETSTGKNNLIDTVLLAFDEKDVEAISTASDKTIRWLSDNVPIIYVKEIPPQLATKEVTSNVCMDLKLLMSDKKLVHYYVDVSSKPPKIAKKITRADSVVWTTTHMILPDDFENRGWIINTDDTTKQDDAVTKAFAEEKEKIDKKPFPHDLRLEIQNAVKIIRQYKECINPMSTTIQEFFIKHVDRIGSRIRRDLEKIDALIDSVTKINYNQRNKTLENGETVIIVHPDDVMYAINLIKKVLPSMIVGIDQRLQKAYEKLSVCEDKFGFVGYKEFAITMKLSQGKAKRLLTDLMYNNLILENEPAKILDTETEHLVETRKKTFDIIPYEELMFDFDDLEQNIKAKYEEWMEENKYEFVEKEDEKLTN